MTAGVTVTLWSDYVSPYAFVARAGAYALEADYEVAVLWRPYTLDIASYMGSVEARDPHHWRRVRYSYMDARRLASKQGLTLRGPKKVYTARPANAGMLYAQRHGVFRAYNDLVFDRFWRRELDPESVEAIVAVFAELGAPAGYAGFLAGDGGAEHDRLRAEAEAAGVFGVPTFILDGELFWGGDRVDLLRERLDEKGVRRRPSPDRGRLP